MSIQFSDTSTYKGLVQLFERETQQGRTAVSGDTDKLKEFTVDVNQTLDEFVELALRSGGTWKFDDSNHTRLPIIYANLVSGQRDYEFTTDQQGNIILDFTRVMVADPSGIYHDVNPKDQQYADNNTTQTSSFVDGRNTGGVPTTYDKTQRSIFFDPIPNYNYTNGIKIFINREAYYMTYTNTTEKPGIPGIFHEYLYLKPAYKYARIHGLANLQQLEKIIIDLEGSKRLGIVGKIEEYFSSRTWDERPRLRANVESNK